MNSTRLLVLLFALFLTSCTLPKTEAPLRFEVVFPDAVHAKPVTGRVLVFLAWSESREPRFGPSLSKPEPLFGLDIENHAPGDPVVFDQKTFNDPTALAFPGPMRRIKPGDYYVQALIDLNTSERSYGRGPGNLYSAVKKVHIDPQTTGTITLTAENRVTPEPLEDTEWVKLVETRSTLMSAFYGRDVLLRAGVILPPGYEENTEKVYPAIYVVPGFGGRHTGAWRWINGEEGEAWQRGEFPSEPMLRIVLDPDVPRGHSTFADSENNGPAGEALLTELIPEIERRFRVIPEPYARLLTGHSSGGWGSLWLQVRYPDFFGGTWSTAPDPVDFRAFQATNLHEDENAYYTKDGFPRPSMRQDGKVVLSIRDENLIEYVTGPGGQWGSWEAAYSPRGPDGEPMAVWNKLTGRINHDVVETWKPYDIRRRLEDNWEDLGPRLHGKLHVIAGAYDNFYLERAARMLADFLETTDYAGYVKILPGDHGSFMTPTLRRQLYEEMAEQFRRNAPPEVLTRPIG